MEISQRRACRALEQSRSTQRYEAKQNLFQQDLQKRVVELASEYGRYGYRQITSMLVNEGWQVGKDRVYTIWRQEGLKVPQKQPKRKRLWLADGSCIRLKPEFKNHVWSYDFVHCRTADNKTFKILNIIDEYTKVCLATIVARRIRSQDVIFILARLFEIHGIPKHIRSDNGPEFVAKKLKAWFVVIGVAPLYIEPGSPWENGYIESFNGKMRYELLNGEMFYSILEAQVVIEDWRNHYNTKRPHSSLGGRTPIQAPPAILPKNFLLAS